MDILISSNLERLLFHLSGENDVEVREYMELLANSGKYTVGEQLLKNQRIIQEPAIVMIP